MIQCAVMKNKGEEMFRPWRKCRLLETPIVICAGFPDTSEPEVIFLQSGVAFVQWIKCGDGPRVETFWTGNVEVWGKKVPSFLSIFSQGLVVVESMIWANQPIYSFFVGCLNPSLQETNVRVGSPQASRCGLVGLTKMTSYLARIGGTSRAKPS